MAGGFLSDEKKKREYKNNNNTENFQTRKKNTTPNKRTFGFLLFSTQRAEKTKHLVQIQYTNEAQP